MPVQFQLEPGKSPTTFYFSVKSAEALEAAGGANPAYLAAAGKQVTACLLMLQYAIDDPTMNNIKARKLLQRYLDAGGKIKPLMDALAKAMNESGVYGDPDDADADTPEDDETEDPTKATTGSL